MKRVGFLKWDEMFEVAAQLALLSNWYMDEKVLYVNVTGNM